MRTLIWFEWFIGSKKFSHYDKLEKEIFHSELKLLIFIISPQSLRNCTKLEHFTNELITL